MLGKTLGSTVAALAALWQHTFGRGSTPLRTDRVLIKKNSRLRHASFRALLREGQRLRGQRAERELGTCVLEVEEGQGCRRHQGG